MPLFTTPFGDRFNMAWSAVGDVVVGNSAAEMSLMAATAQGARVIPANWLQPGRTVRIILSGLYNAALVPGNLTARTKLDGQAIVSGDATALLSLAGARGFRHTTTLTCREAGAQAKITAGGTFEYGIAGNGRQFVDLVSQTGVLTVDGTKDLLIDATAQFATLASANQITVKTGTVELLV